MIITIICDDIRIHLFTTISSVSYQPLNSKKILNFWLNAKGTCINHACFFQRNYGLGQIEEYLKYLPKFDKDTSIHV
jgi:hypothetical protein